MERYVSGAAAVGATHLQVVRRDHGDVFGSEAGVRQGLDVQLDDVHLACGEQRTTCSFTPVRGSGDPMVRGAGGGGGSPGLPLDCSSATSISPRPQPAVSMRSSGVLVSSTAAMPGRSLQQPSRDRGFFLFFLRELIVQRKRDGGHFGCALTSARDSGRSCEPSASPGTSPRRPIP